MKKRIFAGLVATVLMLSACNGGNNNGVEQNAFEFNGYPVKSDQEITYWMNMNANLTSLYSNFGDTPFAQELEKRTGVKVKYVHPAVGQQAQSLSLMIASDEMTDLMEYNWSVYQGGPDISIENETIAPLNDIFKKDAPNLSKYLKENPDVARSVKTDAGKYFVFPFIREDKIQLRATGLMIRRDWLEELGLEIPKTVDELEKVLVAFKEKKGAAAPLSWGPNGHFQFVQMLGGNFNFYLKDGKVVFGPMEPEFKRACEILNKWYKMGILDKNIVSIDNKVYEANILNDKTGVTFSAGGGNLGKWLDIKEGEKFDMVGIPDLVDEKGNNLEYVLLSSNYDGSGVAISATSKNKALAARFLDWGYSKDGYMLYNFGIEGLTYEMKDGVPYYTDEIKKNPEGLPMTQAMAKYFRSSSSGPFIQSKNYLTEYYYRPQQRESLENWLKSYEKGVETREPNITLTTEESDEFAELTVELDKVVDETFIAFVLGTKSFDEYDKFVDTLKKLNVERAIEIKAAAVDRYNNRK